MPEKNPSNRPLAAALGRVRVHMQHYLESADPFLGALYPDFNRGKQLRVRLTLLGAQACGRISPQVERLAAALEFFHYATLIHDDIVDNARQRRHRPTLNVRFGNDTAVMLGDLMLVQVMRILMGHMPAEVQQLTARTAGKVCQGELQEIKARGDLTLEPAAYERIIAQKTACLFTACTLGGGMLAQADKAQQKILQRYGWALGMAFQIQDDLLDLFGDGKKTGKAIGADLNEGRITLPVILGLRILRGAARKKMVADLGRRRKPMAAICRQLQDCGARMETEKKAGYYAQQAIAAAEKLPSTPAQTDLLNLARFAVARKY